MENLVSSDFFKEKFEGKKVFLTGHTGFKGAWLAACLHEFGAIIKGYSLPPSYANGLFDLLLPLNIFENCIADIRDKSKLAKEINDFQPDFIFHLAAQPLVRRSYEIPAETFEINVTGTANLLEAVNTITGKCTIVVITTDKVYENKEQDILYSEDDILGGYDPYSASKACAELVVKSFRNSFFNVNQYNRHLKTLASARAGNVIGGGDWSTDRIIPDIIRSLEKNERITVRNPSAIRPWQHVLEPLAGYLLLAALLDEKPAKFSGAYNFGPYPDDHLTVKELVEHSIKSWGKGNWTDASDPNAVHEAGLLKLDIQKAINELGWKPRLRAAEAIDNTIRWYRENENNRKDFTFQQIKEYFQL